MIKLAEVVQGIEDINKSFRTKQDVKARIKYLHDHLLAEVRGRFTDVDLTLMELRDRLAKYHTQTDAAAPEAAELFEDEIVKKFISDLDTTGITRLSELAQRLRRLRWK